MTHPISITLELALRRCCTESAGQLQAVCLHALAGGGRTRARLLLQTSEREDGPAVKAACALEIMHAATLLQDDIFDRSAERRGRRATYLQFGEAQAILASDWLLLRSLELALEVHPSFFRQLACAARSMAATVAKELNPPVIAGCSAARPYIEEICQGKTASLFAAALHGAALLHHGSDRADALGWAAVGNRIGCAYQLLDDCLDVYASQGSLNKSTGIDLQQGRLTLPILTALQYLESAGRGISIDRFLRSQLLGSERAAIEDAISAWTVRSSLEGEVTHQIQLLEESARTACVPGRAITPVLQDLELKKAQCFAIASSLQGLPERVQPQPALAL